LSFSVFGDSSGDSLRVSELLQEREPAPHSPYSQSRFYVEPRESGIFGKFFLPPSESQDPQGL
jgi:hypothetical protein